MRGNVAAIFHELHPRPFYIDTEAWKRFLSEPTNIEVQLRDQLVAEGLLISDRKEDDYEYKQADGELQQRLDRATILYLVLVEGCNFACPYCPIPLMTKQYGDVYMSPEIARAGIDLWLRHLDDLPLEEREGFIILYGGEPLLNREIIEPTLDYLAQAKRSSGLPPSRISVMVSTNGALIDSRLVELFKEHGVMVAVGCDGPRELHDATRRAVDGSRTFERVDYAIKLLVSNGIRTFASVAITPENIDWIANAAPFFRQYGVEKFGFNFLRGRLLLSLVPEEELQDYYERSTEGVIANARKQQRVDFEYQMEKKYIAYYAGKFFPTDCNAYGNQLVIHPDGEIGNCPFIRSKMGSVMSVGASFRINQAPLVRAWRGRLPLYNRSCYPCDAKSICGGGCAWNAAEVKGDPYAVDDAMCLFTKKVFDLFIWRELTPDGAYNTS